MRASVPLGQLGISEGLRAFVGELPFERRPILDFVMSAASELRSGDEVVDIGAGDAPYRELFSHVGYRTVDWSESQHEGGRTSDLVGSATELPIDDAVADAALLTQVLEHLPEPLLALEEAYRILRPGGALFLTAPMAWEIHEAPHDYFRYTAFGLRHLILRAGFAEVDVKARNDTLTTLAQLAQNCAWHLLGSTAAEGTKDLDVRRRAAQLLLDMSDPLAALGPLDRDWTFPLGYSVRAKRPSE